MRPFLNVLVLGTFIITVGHRLPRFRRAPGTVTDLRVALITDTTATLTWTGVASGVVGPASYDVRWAPAAGYQWYLAKVTPPLTVVGAQAAGGDKLIVTALGLKQQTAYTFQLVAYTGTLNVNAVFGALSNTTTATTLATPPVTPPPPPPSSTAPTVLLTGLPVSVGVTVGQAVEYAALPLDSTNTLTAAPVTWSATDSTVVKLTHPFLGLSQAVGLTALRVGTATVTASAAGLSRAMIFTGLPVDTTTSRYTVTGLQVTNVPRRPYYDFLGPKLVYSGTYLVNLIGVAQDTLKRAVCVVPK